MKSLVPAAGIRAAGLRLGLILGALVLAGTSPVSAQIVLNMERVRLEQVDGGHWTAALGVGGAAGNTRLFELDASGILGHRSKRHWLRFIGGGRILIRSGERILDRRSGQLRYSFLISPRTRTFHFVQLQSNLDMLLEDRRLLGTGIRRTVLQSESLGLDLATGAMLERERLDAARLDPGDEARSDVVRMANTIVATARLAEGVSLLNVAYIQPRLDAPSDVRVLNDLGLVLAVSDGVRVQLAAEWRHDSRPPGALRPNDLSVRTTFSIDRN